MLFRRNTKQSVYVLLAYDSTLHTAQKLSLSAEIEAATKDSYDATVFGKFNYGTDTRKVVSLLRLN